MNLLVSLTLVLTASIYVLGYPSLVKKIPNGNNVMHPCMEGTQWKTVGHQSHNFGNTINPFGHDFKHVSNWTWSKTLCEKDSDDDGRTNGVELGDPNCVWKYGDRPPYTNGITHPGVCEPVDSEYCKQKNSFLKCDGDEQMKCDTINEADVFTRDLRLPVTSVPAVETTYICMTFELPDDQDYHLIAFEPIVDNAAILHHMIIYTCAEGTTVDMPTPGTCEMPGSSDQGCYGLMTIWSAGAKGRCYGDKGLGFPMGKGSTKKVRLELHWNNPLLEKTQTDSSGIRIFYRPAREEMTDLAIFATGQTLLEIPPEQPEWTINASCPSTCMKMFVTQPVHVVDVLNHMHYKGRRMRLEVFRQGRKIKDLSHDEYYDYDTPVFHEHKPPFVLQPDDEVRTTCVYDSRKATDWTFFGDATNDEMCFGFLLMYPKEHVHHGGFCVSNGPLSMCERFSRSSVSYCDWSKFIDLGHNDNKEMMGDMLKNCNLDGFCRPECREVTSKLHEHPCLTGVMGQYVRNRLKYTHEGNKFLTRLSSCQRGAHPRIKDIYVSPNQPPKNCTKQCAKLCPYGSHSGADGMLRGANRKLNLAMVLFTTVIMAAAASTNGIFRLAQ